MTKKHFLYLILLFIHLSLNGQQWHYTWTDEMRESFHEIEALKLDKALSILTDSKSSDPHNLMIPYLEDYIDFFRLFIQEEHAVYDLIKEREKSRLTLLKLGPKEDPNHLLLQAEVLIHWGMIHAKFESYSGAAFNINKAFKLLKRNEAAHPNHMPTKRMISTIRAGVGTIPQKFLWIVKILSSLEGSVESGLAGLKEVYDYSQNNDSFIYKNEALILYTIVATHFGNQAQKMHTLIKKVPHDYQQNPILVFAKASIALETGQNDYVIHLLDQIEEAPSQLPFHYLNYILGLTKLYRCDADSDLPLLEFVNHFKGQNYIKEAYQKLAWHELINDRDENYLRFLNFVQNEGSTVVDADKQAQKEAESNTPPHKKLLRARLLSDGGYLHEAQQVMALIDTSRLNVPELLEYHYRKGRIFQKVGDFSKSIACFQQTIKKGKDSGYYFSCSASLQTGRIYEDLGQPSQALHFYETCLSISSQTYESSLHQKAKAGINRLK